MPSAAAPAPPPVEVLWRPGCGFCASLRRGLRRAGVTTAEHNIWSSAQARARVRSINGGNETVPTVVVGSRSLTNPSVAQVLRTLRTEFPDAPAPTPAPSRFRPRRPAKAAGRAAGKAAGRAGSKRRR